MKKLFLTLIIASLFVCALAFTVGADLIALDYDPGLDCDESLVSTLDYSAFNNSTAQDKESRIILTADGKYYVFPSFYVLWNSSQYGWSFTSTNNAIKAELGIDYDMFGEMKNHLVRIELPSYVTYISSPKFEAHKLLKECIFSENFKSIASQDAFGGCTALEYVSSIENFTQIGAATFVGCSNLAVDIIWPKAITSVPARIFLGCNKLKSITFSEGLTYVDYAAFQGCNEITEMILPNTFKTAAKHAFGSMEKLKVLNLGAGFQKFTSTNFDYETTQNDKSLKYVYLPGNIYENHKDIAVGYGRHIFGAGTNVTFFFTGEKQEAEDLKALFEKIGNNAVFAGATILEYDPTQNYEGYADSLGTSIVVYGYDYCKAFYNNQHINGEQISYESFLCEGEHKIGCTREGCSYGVTSKLNPIFVSLGYSYKSYGNSLSFTQGFGINHKALEFYNNFVSEDEKITSYGVLAVSEGKALDKNPLENGAFNDGVRFVEYSSEANKKFDLFDMRVNGIIDGATLPNSQTLQTDAKIYISAYFKIGDTFMYISDNQISNLLVNAISYNDIAK